MSNFRKRTESERAFLESVRPANWQNKNGAPTKQNIVVRWKKENPTGSKYRCQKETGLSINTIYKWWESNLE